VVPPCSDRISRVPPYSRLSLGITRTGLSPAMAQLSRWFRLSLLEHWPSPRSLATTSGVSVDVLSSRYLDVSVPWVCFYSPILFRDRYLLLITRNPKPDSSKAYISQHQASRCRAIRPRSSRYRRWVAPFGNLRIDGCSHLPVAYRSVPRPSSPLTAKASTKCP
jgi:hypothetical protein